MTVQAAIFRPVGNIRVGLLGITLVAATAFGAGVGLGVSNWLTPVAGTEAVTQAAPAFDAPAFRLEEKLPLTKAAPAFDAPAFRLEEKLP